MKFKEIANRITGISVPIFGVSWNPPILESKIAEKVVIFFEDKRVLYNPFQLEAPRYCTQSIIQIREFINQQLYDVKKGSELDKILRAMRSACHKFLNILQENDFYFTSEGDISNSSFGGQILYFSGIGELRSTFGHLLAKIFVIYKIDCEGELLKIIPLDIDEP